MKKIIILIICLLLCSCTKVSTTFKDIIEPTSSSKLSISFVGDALIHEPIYKSVYKDGTYDFDSIFEYIKDDLNSDLMYYNAETISAGDKIPYSGYPSFNTPEHFPDTMINLGFNVVGRANNHTLDKGEYGVLNACNYWNSHPSVLTNGSACTSDERKNIKVFRKNDITYALLSYTTLSNTIPPKEDYYLNMYSNEQAALDIESIKGVDVIIVAMHWGEEYKNEPTSKQKEIAKYLSSLGVNIIVGTHPHVIEPIEWIGDTLVMYSLGNFLSAQDIIEDYSRRIGLKVDLEIYKVVVGDEVTIKIRNLSSNLIYTYSKNKENYKIIPFRMLNDKILPNYKNLKIKYEKIIKYYDNKIPVN